MKNQKNNIYEFSELRKINFFQHIEIANNFIHQSVNGLLLKLGMVFIHRVEQINMHTLVSMKSLFSRSWNFVTA